MAARGLTGLKDFSLAWRFVDPNYNVLPGATIERLTIYSPVEAEELWREHVDPEARHSMQIPAERLGEGERKRFSVDSNEPSLGKEKFESHVPLAKDAPITIFWSPRVALRTLWGDFLDHWDDFCYPSDDSVVIVADAPKVRLFFADEHILVLSCK